MSKQSSKWLEIVANLNMNNKKLTGLAAGTADTDAATVKQVNDAVAALASGLIYKGTFDASAGNFDVITDPQTGWFYKVTVAGTISAVDYAVGDMIIINKNVVGHPVAADVDKIDNTEAADILRTGDLTSGQMFVGNGSNQATAVSMSGDVTMDNAGATTIGNGKVSNAKLDTALQNKVANITQTKTETLTLDATDITNKYKDLVVDADVVNPADTSNVTPVGGPRQLYTTDYTVITNGTKVKRVNWSGLGMDGVLESGDKLIVTFQIAG